MQRPLVGIIAVVLLAVAGGLWLARADLAPSPQFLPDATADALRGAALRVGLVCGAFWLAWPHLQRVPLWLTQATFVGAVIVAFNRRAAIVVIPLLIVMWIVRPKRK